MPAASGLLNECDVLVVGGGPAGSTISALLAEKGWRVTLLEKEHHPRFHIGDTLLARKFSLKKKNMQHASAAIFGHFLNVDRREGDYAGNISVYWFAHGWFWMIPLRDGSMSVGAVCRPAYLKQRTTTPAEFLLQTIALGHPEMRHRMRNATLINNEARATGNYSYESTRMRGDRYIMVGDAYAFVDPIFSSGVLLGMNSGVLGAEAVDAWLRGDPSAESKFRHFERMV